MNPESRVSVRWSVLIAAAAAVIAVPMSTEVRARAGGAVADVAVGAPGGAALHAPPASNDRDPHTAKITITTDGFNPAKLTLEAGRPAKLTFLKTTDQTCATEVAFPSLKIKKPLPLNKPVVIDLTPEKAGDIEFACGMGMLKGTVVVEQGD